VDASTAGRSAPAAKTSDCGAEVELELEPAAPAAAACAGCVLAKNDLKALVLSLPISPDLMSAGVNMPDARAAAFAFASPSPYPLATAHDHRASALSVSPLDGLRRILTSTCETVYFAAS
jgi:hypothetical protein